MCGREFEQVGDPDKEALGEIHHRLDTPAQARRGPEQRIPVRVPKGLFRPILLPLRQLGDVIVGWNTNRRGVIRTPRDMA